MNDLPLVLLQTLFLDRSPHVMRNQLPNALHRSIGLNVCFENLNFKEMSELFPLRIHAQSSLEVEYGVY